MNVKMEMSDIEKFFMSKDRKKSKKVNTINPASLLEKTKENENKKVKKVSERQQQNQEPQSDLLRKTKEDEDWEDTCEQSMDLANLRIGMMPVKTEEVRAKAEVVHEEVSGDEDDGDRVDKHAHPWGGKVQSATLSEPEPVESNQSKKYVVPSMRSSSGMASGLKAPKKAPNISNSAEFPSLREAVDIETEDSSWSRVTKNGHSQVNDKPTTTIKKESISSSVVASATVSDTKSTPQPTKYLPPHLRKAQNAHRPNENKFNVLKEESLN